MACVTVIGTGLLGKGIAEVLMRGSHQVILHDFATASLESAQQSLGELGRTLGVSVRAEPSLDAAVEPAAFVVEAVTENLALKQSIFERAGAVNRRAVLMSNSSVLPIGRIAERTAAPERAVGTHWWNPPQLIPIVEVIRGPRTSEDVMVRTIAFHAALGKLPVRVERDLPGFIGNRLQHALWREALALVSSGVCAAQRVDCIASATLGQDYAEFGPWAQMQRSGWPQVIRELESALPLINSEPRPAQLLRDKVAQGQLGAKSGQGFLAWEEGARTRAATRLAEHVAARIHQRATGNSTRAGSSGDTSAATLTREDADVARRLKVAVWREAIALVEHQVCGAAEVDRVVCNTIGLRLAAMGPVSNADYVGLDLTLAIHESVLPSLESGIGVPALILEKAGLR
jgi:3-hydroxybutyryl-CoA dehydrogenase